MGESASSSSSLASPSETNLACSRVNTTLGGSAGAKVWQFGPDPAEWGTEPEMMATGIRRKEKPSSSPVGPSQVKACRGERGGCLENGIDVQSNLMLEHVGVKNDTSVSLETFPDHPPEGNAGETVTLTVLDRSTPNI
jgi:hypothetical protein